jgi:hypothetical protein
MRKIARGRLECASLVLKPAKWCFWGPILTTCGTPEETYPEFSDSFSRTFVDKREAKKGSGL